MLHRKPLAFAAALALVSGCEKQPTSPDAFNVAGLESSPAFSVSSAGLAAGRADLSLQPASSPQAALDMINERLWATGQRLAVHKAEYVTGGPQADAAGQTVFATDRQLRLDTKWVPGDGRRGAVGNLIRQITWLPFAPANFGTPDQIDGLPPIDASFDTWNDVKCSKLDIATLAPTLSNPSAILSVGGVPGDPFQADISTIGFLPGALFDAVLGPGAADNVLGVTFTFTFVDAEGNPTDVDGDGRADTALKEVWYNDAFLWSTSDAPGSFDLETVTLHENGHALELGHFGRVAITNSNGRLHVSPRAVMNALILGTLRMPLGTDNGAYCGNFASWPN